MREIIVNFPMTHMKRELISTGEALRILEKYKEKRNKHVSIHVEINSVIISRASELQHMVNIRPFDALHLGVKHKNQSCKPGNLANGDDV